jgi:hypothetical protein
VLSLVEHLVLGGYEALWNKTLSGEELFSGGEVPELCSSVLDVLLKDVFGVCVGESYPGPWEGRSSSWLGDPYMDLLLKAVVGKHELTTFLMMICLCLLLAFDQVSLS